MYSTFIHENSPYTFCIHSIFPCSELFIYHSFDLTASISTQWTCIEALGRTSCSSSCSDSRHMDFYIVFYPFTMSCFAASLSGSPYDCYYCYTSNIVSASLLGFQIKRIEILKEIFIFKLEILSFNFLVQVKSDCGPGGLVCITTPDFAKDIIKVSAVRQSLT